MNLFDYEFMRFALIGGVLASVACGIMGSFVVAKRIVFISGGISHASFGGIGLAYLMNWNPMWGAFIFSILSSMGIGFLSKKTHQREDTSIGIIWALGMSFGILCISLSKGYAPDLMTYLFGNILAITKQDLIFMGVLDIVIVVCIGYGFKAFRAICFDEEFASTRGLPVFGLYLFLLALIALTIVVLMKSVGIILVVALLTLPCASASRLACTLKGMMGLSIVFSAVSIVVGLMLSFWQDIPSGAAIILFAGALYILTTFCTQRRHIS